MDPNFKECLNLFLRWFHVIAGIMWIGNSLLFNWLDRNLRTPRRKGLDTVGEIWLLHSGGFYMIHKSHLRTAELPPFVHWFKWQSYSTWLSGFLLLIIIYYMGGGAFLVDPGISSISVPAAVALGISVLVGAWLVYDLIWRSPLARNKYFAVAIAYSLLVAVAYALCHIFSGRAAYLHVGALLGTLMAGNVFFHIIPSQRQLVKATSVGRQADIALSDRAKERSIHNNYMTFSVIFLMLSNHFPVTYGNANNWIILAMLVLASALVRHFMNIRFTMKGWLPALLSTLSITFAALVYLVAPPAIPEYTAGAEGAADEPVTFAQARAVISLRCLACHSINPTDPANAAATGGVRFDTPAEIKNFIQRIEFRAVISKTMPLANRTGITQEERERLGRWIRQGATME